MSQDEEFAKQAESLARISAQALEEARSYASDIKDKHLREETEKKIDKIVETL